MRNLNRKSIEDNKKAARQGAAALNSQGRDCHANPLLGGSSSRVLLFLAQRFVGALYAHGENLSTRNF